MSRASSELMRKAVKEIEKRRRDAKVCRLRGFATCWYEDWLDPVPAPQDELFAVFDALDAAVQDRDRWKETADRQRAEFLRIAQNAESHHGDDAAKARALAVIADWARDAALHDEPRDES